MGWTESKSYKKVNDDTKIIVFVILPNVWVECSTFMTLGVKGC